MRLFTLIAVAFFAALLLGCVGGQPAAGGVAPNVTTNVSEKPSQNVTTNVTVPTAGNGTVKVKLASTLGQIGGTGLKSANLTIIEVEIYHDYSPSAMAEGWSSLNKTVLTLDLVDLSKKPATIAAATIADGHYNRIRLSSSSLKTEVTISSSIPGIIENIAAIDASITQQTEVPIDLTVTKNSSQIVTITIDVEKSLSINKQALTAVFNATANDAVQTVGECKSMCRQTCNSTAQQCEASCRLDKDTECSINATTVCKEDCGCVPSCDTLDKENCRLACTPTKLNDCRAIVNATCAADCAVSTAYLNCINACEGDC